MNTTSQPLNSPTVMYDGQCAMCMTGAGLLERPLANHGVASTTLQANDPTREHSAMEIHQPDGRVLRGAECWVYIARQLWWARPLAWFAALPGGMAILHLVYATIARNRQLISRFPFWSLLAARKSPRTLWIQTTINAPRQRIWELTQTPDQHQRWDLPFSTITYLPRQECQPQQFRYVTRIGLGLSIAGGGETTGVRTGGNDAWNSALKFWSHDRLSLIRTGAGFWRYQTSGQGTFFLTRYDYQTRFGFAGRAVDRLFRPLMAWATAWSFDRLKIWAERGTPPETSRNIALAATVARLGVAGFWLYGGLVPKLLTRAPDELALAGNVVSPHLVFPFVLTLGVLEILLGLTILTLWQKRWPLWVTLALMPIVIAILAISSPAAMLNMFSPIVFNLSLAAFAILTLLLQPMAPSSSRTQWGVGRAPKEQQ